MSTWCQLIQGRFPSYFDIVSGLWFDVRLKFSLKCPTSYDLSCFHLSLELVSFVCWRGDVASSFVFEPWTQNSTCNMSEQSFRWCTISACRNWEWLSSHRRCPPRLRVNVGSTNRLSSFVGLPDSAYGRPVQTWVDVIGMRLALIAMTGKFLFCHLNVYLLSS